MTDREDRARARLAYLLHEAGISKETFALIAGREAVVFSRYFGGGVIPKTFCSWLDRVESMRFYEGGVDIKLRLPLIRRSYNAPKLPILVTLGSAKST